MAKTKYEKPMRALLKDMLVDWCLQPGQVFTKSRAQEWFQERYPLFSQESVRAHLVQASTNDPNRMHFSATNETDDLLVRVATNQYRLYEPGKDPAPIHEFIVGDVEKEELRTITVTGDHRGDDLFVGDSAFAYEADLQNYLAKNLQLIEAGLKPAGKDDEALEYDAGNKRRIDILAIDKDGGYVVIELKVDRGYDQVLGQLSRYMGWIRKRVAEPGQRVRGVIVCRELSEDLRIACSENPNIALFEYNLAVSLKPVPVFS